MPNKNIFDIKEEFFVIDSEHLDEVKEKLYGFAIIDGCLVENINDMCNQDPKGNGAYVCVKKNDRHITITQDFIGSYGLYLYRDKDYFALSNSFIALLDYVKLSRKITFNRDFANYMLSAELCSASFSHTMVNEISILDRCSVVEIDSETKLLTTSYVDYRENTVELSSSEGMQILDLWYHKWTTLIRNLYNNGCDISFDLSGGFDTRMILTLFLGAGIDMNNICVNSIKDDLHTHTEDYEIASAMSTHYGFELNNNSILSGDRVNYSIEDILNISFYLKLSFHKQMYPRFCHFNKLRHYFGGSGGECVRDYWNITPENYILKALNRCKDYPVATQKEFEESTRKVLNTSFEEIQQKFERFERTVAPEELSMNLYRETRCRNHFGKDILENYYGGSVKYAPLLDPDLHKLKLCDDVCGDKNLLMAVIFDRYNGDLLDFKFDSNRSINKNTIEYAQELSRKFPYTAPVHTQQTEKTKHTICTDTPPLRNTDCPYNSNDFKETVLDIFHSDKNRAMFELLYGEDIYTNISWDVHSRKYQPLQSAYTVIAISKILQDVLSNENSHCSSLAESFHSSTLPRKNSFSEKETLLKDPYLENYITLRIDIKNNGSDNNDMEIFDISDANLKIFKPAWLAKNGNGYSLESIKGNLDLKLRCVGTGNFSFTVLGKNVLDENKERVPFWIDLHSFTINGEEQFDTIKTVCHDNNLRIMRNIEDGEVVHLHFQWSPHHLIAPPKTTDKNNDVLMKKPRRRIKAFLKN